MQKNSVTRQIQFGRVSIRSCVCAALMATVVRCMPMPRNLADLSLSPPLIPAGDETTSSNDDLQFVSKCREVLEKFLSLIHGLYVVHS